MRARASAPLHIRKDVRVPDMRVKLRALHQVRRLLARPAQEQRRPEAHLIGEILERLQP